MPKNSNLITLETEKFSPEPILLALVGLNPAVLTETIYALCKADTPVVPQRVIAITTTLGREFVAKKLFERNQWEVFRQKMLADLDPDYSGHLAFSHIAECVRVIPNLPRNKELSDIRSVEDSEAVAEFLHEILRGYTSDPDTRVIASLAGGRKTMGAVFASVMCLLGRSQDQMLHVLVNDPWDRIPDFLYPGCAGDFFDPDSGEPLNSRNATLEIADIPFVPLRYLFNRELGQAAGSYRRIVRSLRKRASQLDTELEIEANLREGLLTINGRRIQLTSNEFGYYSLFLQRARSGLEPIDQYTEPLIEELKTLAKDCAQPDDFAHWSHHVLETDYTHKEDFRKFASSIRKRLRDVGFDGYQINRLVPQRGRLSIDVDPEFITIKRTSNQ